MRLLAPAKINLHLRVGASDKSGFHPLVSWMCTVGLFDSLTIDPVQTGEVSLSCDDPSLPIDSRNLVIRAVELMKQGMTGTPGQSAAPPRIALSSERPETERSGAPFRSAPLCPGVRLHLNKTIPTGGGLGGGSSDAARVLLCLNRLWHLNWSLDRLSSIAAILGSDVPFFLHDASSVCTGRGEIVRSIARPTPRWAILILPNLAVSTAAVYRRFDEMKLGEALHDGPWQQWAELSAGLLLPRLVNNLERPAFDLCPQLSNLRADVEQSIGRIVRMSGSGSSLFSLFDEKAEAESSAARVKNVKAIVVQIAPDFEDDLNVV